jgi:membrane AbrB-like protein
MSELSNLRQQLPIILKTLAVGIPAGYVFHRLHTPIPWMVGPMIAVALLNLMGVRMRSVPYGRQMVQVILGSAVSLYFTPTVVAALAGNFAAIMAATVAVFLVGGFGALTLSRASGVDGKSTFFASIPGGAMAMAVLAEPAHHHHGDRHFPQWIGGDDHHRAGLADQRSLGGRLSFISGGGRQYRHPIHLCLRRASTGTKRGSKTGARESIESILLGLVTLSYWGSFQTRAL